MNTAPTLILGCCTLYLGDCRGIAPQLTGIDAVVTDPPYEIHAGAGGGCFGNRDHLVKTGGFTDGGCDYGFLEGHRNWFCFCSRKQLRALLGLAEKCDRYNVLAWCKPNPVPTCNNKYLPDMEFIIHGFASGRLFGDFNLKSSFMVYPCGQKETDHPNEKPVPLMSKLVRLCTLKGETVLDPFSGSGATAIACIRTGRKFIGIELDPAHYATAVARIRRELEQGVLPLAYEPSARPEAMPELFTEPA